MAKAPSGILISFEGTEGSGKSTLIRTLSKLLDQAGYTAIQTREPGGSPVAEKIRSILLEMSPKNLPDHTMNPWTELLLYEAARAEHTAKTIVPALERGEIVICDRFTDSTLAYQGHARGLPWKQIRTLNRMATFGIKPDLTFFLNIDPAVGLRRVQDPNRFEAEGLEFQKKVRAGFVKVRAEEPKRWITLNVQDRSPDDLAKAVLMSLLKRLSNRMKQNLNCRRNLKSSSTHG